MFRDRSRALRLTRQWRAARHGFTLIELLVVIAILTILAGILFPVFSQVRERARQATCVSNLRQVSMAMRLYDQDYDGRLVPAVSYGPEARQYFQLSWMHLLGSYVKDNHLFLDPSSRNRNADWRASSDLLYNNYGYAPSARVLAEENSAWVPLDLPGFGSALWEGLGGFCGRPIGWYTTPAPSASADQVARPSETILVCDHLAFDWGWFAQQLYFPEPRHMREDDVQLPGGVTVPEGLINCAFVDGHVQALKHSQFWAILPDRTRRGGQPQHVFRHFWPYE